MARMRVAALKPYGLGENQKDWAIFKTPEVWIQGKASQSPGGIDM